VDTGPLILRKQKGVCLAVEHGFLETVRFFVTQGSTDCGAADVFESYTLNFTYDHSNADGSNVRSVSIDGNHAFDPDNALKSFKRAIKSLLLSLEGLPTIPRELCGMSPLITMC
jgi:hypothetical protein